MRILAVDPGEKRIGLAISDPTGSIAGPVGILLHTSRPEDAAQIARIAAEHEAGRIIVGQTLDDEGEPTPEGRKAARLAQAICEATPLPVELWDESGSTQQARQAMLSMGTRRSRRKGHHDALAAVIILQSYLDATQERGEPDEKTP